MTEYCRNVDYTKYETNSIFYGSIVSTFSKINQLIYCIDNLNFQHLLEIDEYKQYKSLLRKPDDKTIFVYYSSSKHTFYRALNLGKNPSDPLVVKLYYIDTGEIKYVDYNAKQFFYLPDKFCKPPMGLFCKINKYPKQFKTIFDFIDRCTYKRLKFRVCGKMYQENLLGSREECLIVDIEDEDYQEEDDQFPKLTKSALIKFESAQSQPLKFEYASGPIMSNVVAQKMTNLQVTEKIILHPGIMLKVNKFYGICKSMHKAHRDTDIVTRIMIKLNSMRMIHVELNRRPLLNEMVVACEIVKGSKRFYRGLVKEIYDDIYMILYVDYGYVRPFHYKSLFKFPRELAKIPFHYFRIHASNVEIGKDSAQNHSNMIIVQKYIMPFGYGIVEKIDDCDIVVKLYDNRGIDMNEVLMIINKPHCGPKIKKK